MLLGLLALPALAILGLFVADGSFSDSGQKIMQEEFGEDWPLTVSKGILRCEMHREITFQHAGTTYTLNGTVKHGANSDIGPILAIEQSGATKDVAPLVERGLRLCD